MSGSESRAGENEKGVSSIPCYIVWIIHETDQKALLICFIQNSEIIWTYGGVVTFFQSGLGKQGVLIIP